MELRGFCFCDNASALDEEGGVIDVCTQFCARHDCLQSALLRSRAAKHDLGRAYHRFVHEH